MNPINSYSIQKQISTKRNEFDLSHSQIDETNAEKIIKLNDIPFSQLGTLSYIDKKQKDNTLVLSNKDIINFKNLSQHIKDANLANIPELSSLTSEERENLTSILTNLDVFDQFLLTITSNKPATLISDINDINIQDNIKGHKVIKKKLKSGLTRCYILNTKEVTKIIDENKELFETRLNAHGKSSDEIYELLSDSNKSPLLNNDINTVSDMVGLILGYPKISSIIYHLAFNSHNLLDDQSNLQKSKDNLVDYIYSDESPYINMDEDFLSDLIDDIQNITGHDFLQKYICEKMDDYKICPIQCAVFLPENEEFMRIKNAILNCTKRLSELQKS